MRLINKVIIPFIILITTWYASNTQWGKNHWQDIIEADAKGYYAYLPAVFIYHDLNFGFHDYIEKKYYNPNTYYEYRTVRDGKLINKYFTGVAFAELPFFLTAHVITKLIGNPADGYSKLYPIFINIGAIVFLTIGLFYLKKFLQLYHIRDNLISITLLAIVFGTNLLYYTVSEPGMSHIYSFALINIFLYSAKLFFSSYRNQEILACAALLGFIILVRPVNGLILFIIPFLAGNKENLIQGIKKLVGNPIIVFGSMLIILLIISIQFFIYKIQCGSFFVYSYGEEGFNWSNPQVLNFLFSYKKGFFLYTPLALLSIFGLIPLWKKTRYEFYTLTVFLLLLLYVLSSWWNWWYGGSFSSRVMVEYLALFAFLSANILQFVQGNKPLTAALHFTIFFTIILCQVQMYEYRYFLIHWDSMTKEKYREVFFRLP